MIRKLILDERKAREFAGRTIAEMIRLGASPQVMRQKDIPKITFFGVFGGRKWERTTPRKHALEMLVTYKPSCLFEQTRRGKLSHE